jgi:hypothetical protein
VGAAVDHIEGGRSTASPWRLPTASIHTLDLGVGESVITC